MQPVLQIYSLRVFQIGHRLSYLRQKPAKMLPIRQSLSYLEHPSSHVVPVGKNLSFAPGVMNGFHFSYLWHITTACIFNRILRNPLFVRRKSKIFTDKSSANIGFIPLAQEPVCLRHEGNLQLRRAEDSPSSPGQCSSTSTLEDLLASDVHRCKS